MSNEIIIEELNRNYLKSLKKVLNSEVKESTPSLREYYQYLSNSLDFNDECKEEQRKLNRIKTSVKLSELENRVLKVNWNLEYCLVCKLDYWPSNCRVFIQPKCRVTRRSSLAYTKFKLFDFKPRHKSYKDKLLENVYNKGARLIYECKRCRAKNVILNQTKRVKEIKCVLLKNTSTLIKNLKQKAIRQSKLNSVSFGNFQKLDDKPTSTLNQTANVINVKSKKKFAGKKKFQSLQVKLRQSEEEMSKNQTQKTTASLTDFLMQLT